MSRLRRRDRDGKEKDMPGDEEQCQTDIDIDMMKLLLSCRRRKGVRRVSHPFLSASRVYGGVLPGLFSVVAAARGNNNMR